MKGRGSKEKGLYEKYMCVLQESERKGGGRKNGRMGEGEGPRW